LLTVLSAQWGDWSWPKGKLDPGETLPECAVREVGEETGVDAELGRPLPAVSYLLPDGRAKTVSYWAARVRAVGPRTASDDEIAAVEWLSVPAALERLSRPGDLAPLRRLLELDAHGQLDTHPLLVLRHAKARGRAHWPGDEADRPLTATGLRQAQSLVGLLACWQPQRLLSSPWVRCMQTLRPYLDHLDNLDHIDNPGNSGNLAEPERLAGLDSRDNLNQLTASRLEPEVLPLLSELGLQNDPSRIGATIAELLDDSRGALLCTHRPVLATVMEALREAAVPEIFDQFPEDQFPEQDPWLAPAEVLVAHVSKGDRQQTATSCVQAVERHRPESSRKRRRRSRVE
jgi:8-oxo-dGTP diphosphatase